MSRASSRKATRPCAPSYGGTNGAGRASPRSSRGPATRAPTRAGCCRSLPTVTTPRRSDLVAEDQQRLLLWLDANVPFYGAYREADRQAQREGKRVAPPTLE